MAGVAFALAAVSLVSSILFILMFLLEVPDNGPYRFGTAYEVLAIIDSLLSAALVVHLSRKAARSTAASMLVLVLAVLLVVNALFAVLFLMHSVGPGPTSLIAVLALLLQGFWMFWVNRRLAVEGLFPRLLATWGWLIGAGLVIGLLLSGIGLTFPQLSIPELLFLVPGIFIAGGVWLVWPVWYVLLGFRLLRGAPATRTKSAKGTGTKRATDARARGRRKA